MSEVRRWWPQLLMGDDVEMREAPCPYPEDPLYVLATDYDKLERLCSHAGILKAQEEHNALRDEVGALRAVITEVHEAAASGLLDTSFLASMPPKNTVAHTILQILKQSPADGERGS